MKSNNLKGEIMSIVTWNMQGGTNSIDSKWTMYVKQLVRSFDVVCLQEAGALPRTALIAVAPGWNLVPPMGVNTQYVTWNIGTTSRPEIVYILWVNTDPKGGRVNLAICSKIAPTGLLYAAPGLANGRPSIGMVIGGNNYYTLHAFSGGGGDAGGLITNINAGPGPWFALGDYNRMPNWGVTAGTICPPNGQTHQGGGFLDYMVKFASGTVNGQVQQIGSWSDHYYVGY
jgi:cytolethal distending toxin subunit B